MTKQPRLTKINIVIAAIVCLGLLIGIIASLIFYNIKHRSTDQGLEITFVDPHQAVIFWKTEETTLGYLTYGPLNGSQSEKVDQTSSTPGTIHTVVIDEIPLEGLSATIHNQSDSLFFIPKSFKIAFNPEEFE